MFRVLTMHFSRPSPTECMVMSMSTGLVSISTSIVASLWTAAAIDDSSG